MKYYKTIGVFACALLIISCFLPWAFYADINKSFTGLFTEQNIYGKPGKVFIFLAVCATALILTNKIWAKRTLIFLSAINLAYFIKTYVLFTTCYATICPVKQYGLYLLMAASILLMIATVFPNTKITKKAGEIE